MVDYHKEYKRQRLGEVETLQALYNNAKVAKGYSKKDISYKDADKLFDAVEYTNKNDGAGRIKHFGVINGRTLNIDFVKDDFYEDVREIDETAYDKANGTGAAQKAILGKLGQKVRAKRLNNFGQGVVAAYAVATPEIASGLAVACLTDGHMSDGAAAEVAYAGGMLSPAKLIIGAIATFSAMGGITAAHDGALDNADRAYRELINASSQVLASKIENVNSDFSNVIPNSIIVDPVTGKVTGIMSYEAKDTEGDSARYLGKYSADCSKDVIENYTTCLDEYTKTHNYDFEKAHSITGNRNFGNAYFSSISDQNKLVADYYDSTIRMADSVSNLVDEAKNYTITPVAKAYDFNQSLLKQALYTNPTLISNTSGSVRGFFASGSVSTDFISNGTYLLNVSDVTNNEQTKESSFKIDYLETSGRSISIKQSKQVCDTSALVDGKTAYTTFVENGNKSFSQNIINDKDENTANDTATFADPVQVAKDNISNSMSSSK